MAVKHVLLINSSVPDYQVFLDSVNESTCAILYSSSTTKEELIDLVQQKTTTAERMAIVSRKEEPFVEYKQIPESEEFLLSFIESLGIKTVDFLACNTLADNNWVDFYDHLHAKGIIVGASDNLTGNLKYGGDWIMESTGQDIEQIYFNKTIEYYTYLLDLGKCTFFLKDDGLYGMGDRIQGTRGTPVKINLPDTVKQISVSKESVLILLQDGNVYAIGSNRYGELGLGDKTSRTSFTQVTYLSNVDMIAGGGSHIALLKGTELFIAGTFNSNTYLFFTKILDVSGVTKMQSGNDFIMVLKNNELWGLGQNSYGRLGLGSTSSVNTFTVIPNTSGVTHFSCGGEHTLIVRNNELWGCGTNYARQLGITGLNVYNTFTIIPNMEGVTQISCGADFTTVLKGGNVYAAGTNYYGQLGLGDNVSRNSFVMNMNHSGITQIMSAYNHSMILKNGTLWGAGNNYDGPLGLLTSSSVLTFTSSVTNVLYLFSNNSIYTPTPVVVPTPVVPPITSMICFPAGSHVKTDQGLVEIQNLNPGLHKIHGKSIIAITNTFSMDKVLVCIEKDALRKNYPNERTLISKRHKIYYNGKMKAAQRFVGNKKGVSFVPYEGDKLYNVLLDEYSRMNVNGMICETLHPVNPVSKLFNPALQ